jgi:uncharacterized protein (TIGR02145 family)
MKKVYLLIILVVVLILSCKKQSDNNDNQSALHPTGLITETPEELQSVQLIEINDSSMFPYIGNLKVLPDSIVLNVPIPGDQEGNNSCTAWGIGFGLLSYHFKVFEGNSEYIVDGNFSPPFIWNQLNGGGNNGISIYSGLYLVKEMGCCKLPDMPVTSPYNVLPSSEAKEHAKSFKLTDFGRLDNNINVIKTFVSRGYPIVVGLEVDSSFCKDGESQFEKKQDGRLVWANYSDNERYNHCMLICGYDNTINSLKVLNSWGIGWGNDGYIWIDYDHFKKVVVAPFGYASIWLGVIKRPYLYTTSVSEITQSSATCSGNVTADWFETVTERGICWSTSTTPDINDNKITGGTGLGNYSCTINNLSSATNYYVKAYAINKNGISYGLEKTFKTSEGQSGLPIIVTSQVTSITSSSATSGGTITDDGGSSIIARGVCWNISPNPTLSNVHTNDGTGNGNFSSQISGLTPNTPYYIRAYATNSVGTAYGNEIYFTSALAPVEDIDGNVYHPIQIGTQIWLKENLNVTRYNNGEEITNVPDLVLWLNLATGAYVNYNNDVSYASTYGRLYNYYAATDSRKICPTGWHVPSNVDWSTLVDYLGGANEAGGKMKAIGTVEQGNGLWYSPNTFASNTSGFTGIPGGIRDNYDFRLNGYHSHYWSSSETSTYTGWIIYLSYNNPQAISWPNDNKVNGYSIRCIKD